MRIRRSGSCNQSSLATYTYWSVQRPVCVQARLRLHNCPPHSECLLAPVCACARTHVRSRLALSACEPQIVPRVRNRAGRRVSRVEFELATRVSRMPAHFREKFPRPRAALSSAPRSAEPRVHDGPTSALLSSRQLASPLPAVHACVRAGQHPCSARPLSMSIDSSAWVRVVPRGTPSQLALCDELSDLCAQVHCAPGRCLRAGIRSQRNLAGQRPLGTIA